MIIFVLVVISVHVSIFVFIVNFISIMMLLTFLNFL